jgi:hypothetical protein
MNYLIKLKVIMRLNENVLKYFSFLLPLIILMGFNDQVNAQEEREYVKVTERGVDYVLTDWDTYSIYDPYNYSFYISEIPAVKAVFTRTDYYVALDSLDRSPVFSFDGTCLLEKDGSKQLECSNEDLFNYIQYQNIEYPENEDGKVESGIVYISFLLNQEGNIENIKVVRNEKNCQACIDTAVDLIKNSEDNWYPAIKDGETITTNLTVPIRFDLKTIDEGLYPNK